MYSFIYKYVYSLFLVLLLMTLFNQNQSDVTNASYASKRFHFTSLRQKNYLFLYCNDRIGTHSSSSNKEQLLILLIDNHVPYVVKNNFLIWTNLHTLKMHIVSFESLVKLYYFTNQYLVTIHNPYIHLPNSFDYKSASLWYRCITCLLKSSCNKNVFF